MSRAVYVAQWGMRNKYKNRDVHGKIPSDKFRVALKSISIIL
jgi:hypothetical protein